MDDKARIKMDRVGGMLKFGDKFNPDSLIEIYSSIHLLQIQGFQNNF